MALFFCRRRAKEPPKRRSPRFSVKEIEPFLTVGYPDGAPLKTVVPVVIGVAIQKADGTWGTHELTDEMDLRRPLRARTFPEPAERVGERVAMETKRRLVEALNRLNEHYERVYVYVSPGGAGSPW